MSDEFIFQTQYVAKIPDADLLIKYSEEENQVWHDLYHRQIQIIENRACDEYLQGLDILKMSSNCIPQIPDLNKALQAATGWSVYPVPALIGFDEFFNLLANRQFPAATFIRKREDFDYITEPDIFHEFFGHCPMLTEPVYADFMQAYGKLGLEANAKDQVMLARLYWFTVEFGLIETPTGTRIYGGGILSSPSETVYAVESSVAQRKPFHLVDIFRTPYRIDILQPIYYVIKNYHDLYDVMKKDIFSYIQQARDQGMFDPTFDNEKQMKFC